MMRQLLVKEFRLALVAPAIIFEFFGVMLLIPSYPFLITYFYGTLGIFFICMFGRENHDVLYTALLPVSRPEIVKARITLCVILEVVLIGTSALFAVLRKPLGLEPNMAGLDPNVAFFGVALTLVGLFNIIFFPGYYRNTNKIGIPFLIASLVYAGGMLAAEAFGMMPGPVSQLLSAGKVAEQAVILAAGAAVYILLTWASLRISIRRFRKMNLTA